MIEEKAKKKKSNNYFTKDTELAIVKYNETEDPVEKNKIYEAEIHQALFKLTQNLIHTFKFYYTEESILEDLQHEVIIFVLTKLHKFDPTNGAKAYSYFGTVAKRYLIASNQKNYKKRLDFLSLDDLHLEQEDNSYAYGEPIDYEENTPEELMLQQENNLTGFMNEYVDYCTENIYELFPKEEQAKVADAILELFRKRNDIALFKKKALYIYIREMTDVKTGKITKAAKVLAAIYKKHYLFYLENGYTNF
jgi:DNA-directed RNA polymerase specialized sigma24 family protein